VRDGLDENAVVDQHLKGAECDGPRVVDASVMPTVVSFCALHQRGHRHAPDKTADLIKGRATDCSSTADKHQQQ